MPPPSQPQPVTRSSGRTSLSSQAQPVAGPSSHRLGASPMTGISFANGGGFSFDKHGNGGGGAGYLARSVKMSGVASGGGNGAGSYGARFYGGGFDSPSHPFSTSITMESSSFTTSSAAFNLPPPLSTSSSFRGGRSYAAAAKGERDYLGSSSRHPQYGASGTRETSGALSTSFAGMSFQPMSFSFGQGNGSYSKSQVHSLMASRPRTDAELTRTYECCGNTHHGLHDLLEHVEDAHPFADADMPPSGAGTTSTGGAGMPIQHIGFSPQVMAMEMDMDLAEPSNLGTIEERASGGGSTRSSMSPSTIPSMPSYPMPTTSASSSKPSTPNEGAPSPAALQISDVLTSPFGNSPLISSSGLPPTPGTTRKAPLSLSTAASAASTSSSSPPEGSLATPTTSQQPSPVFAVPKIGPTRGFLGSVPRPPSQRFDRAFNEVVAGSPKDKDDPMYPQTGIKGKAPVTPTAVAPGILFASAVAGLGIPTAPPVPGQKPEAAKPVDGTGAPNAGTAEAQLPQPSMFTTHKPWRCPNPGCNKAYKQSNGLKYHQQKGQCDFAIHDAVDLGLSVEEAEERSRPFLCAVGAGCMKRYRQMNGLKYHYLNSGEHGQYGLRMLQNGSHPMPPGAGPSGNISTAGAAAAANALLKRPVPTSTAASGAAPSTASGAARPSAAPYHIPSQIGATRPRMGVFPPTPSTMASGVRPIPGAGGAGLAGVVRAGVPVRPSATMTNTTPFPPLMTQQPKPAHLPPIQRGRDAVLFAAVETMDL